MDNGTPGLDPGRSPAPEAPSPGALPEEPRRGRALLTFGLILVGAALLIFGAHRYASRQPLATGATAAVWGEGTGEMAPDFSLKDIHGNTFRMSDLKGKVVIVDFWATWCQPCKIEIPWFVDMYDRYKAQGLEVVGVAMDDDGQDVVKPFTEKYRMNYRVLIGNDDVATQFGGIFGLPTTFIIGRDGRIQGKHIGLVSRDTLEETVKKLL